MASLIHEIENNESLLLMFVSGELPAEDRAEVEQMLSADAGLREELARVESAYSFAMEALASADENRAGIAGENHAIRQAKRAMKQWQIDRKNRRPAPVQTPSRHIPSWMYGGAVAALIMFGLLTYWGFAGENLNSPNGSGTLASKTDNDSTTHQSAGQTEAGRGWRGHSGDRGNRPDLAAADIRADRLEYSLNRGEAISGIEDAERQASSLMARSDNQSASSILLFDNAE